MATFRKLILEVLFSTVLVSGSSGQTYLGNYTAHEANGKALTVWAGASGLRFVFYKPDIVRVDCLPTPGTVIDSSLVVIRDTTLDVPFIVSDSSAFLTIVTPALKIVCSKTPVRVAFYAASGKLLLSEGISGGLWWSGTARGATFQMGPDDHFYGTGERGTALDKRGQAFGTYNAPVGGYRGPVDQMSINIPFTASTNGYALYFENTYPGRFDFGYADPSVFWYAAYGGELSYFFIAAATIPAQLEEYTWLTGRQPLPPRWALGYIQSKYGYRNDAEARQMVQTMRSKQIPCDAIVLDLYWFNRMGDLSWNSIAFPQPSVMMSDLRVEGMKTVVITEPYVTGGSLNFPEGEAYGYFAKNALGQSYILPNWWSCSCDAVLLDITNPSAQTWWWQRYQFFMGSESIGVAGFWTDLGEPERHPTDMLHVLGSAAKVHNIYNLLWARTVFNGFNVMRPDRRIFNLTRSGYAGIQRYGAIPWSGDVGKDFGGLAVQLPMMLNMGISGLAYHNSDIGGFCCGTTTEELYVRWMQYGTFCPIARAHGVGEALGGQGTEPWTFGANAEAICKSFIELRYRLLPYVYTLAYNNFATGMPIAHPLFFDSGDPSLLNQSSSYMWGNALLVSPVVQSGQTSKDVYLPEGGWIDYWTEGFFNGLQTVNIPTPLERLPIFVRAGSIIPMQPVMNYTDERILDTLMLAVYAVTGTSGQFTLYEDDGTTLAYQGGACSQTTLSEGSTAGGGGSTLTISIGKSLGVYNGKPTHRIFLSEVHGVYGEPALVRCNGSVVPEAASYTALRAGANGFFYDAALHRLFIHTPTVPDSSYVLTLEQIQLTGVRKDRQNPDEFLLGQNYPNPFNPTTTIRFQVPVVSQVSLKVYDLLGREVTTLVNEQKHPGSYTVNFDGSTLATGVYIYRLSTPSFSVSRSMELLK
jgi:alpha-glucosidase (family GH31 glycosyl hydrolase)